MTDKKNLPARPPARGEPPAIVSKTKDIVDTIFRDLVMSVDAGHTGPVRSVAWSPQGDRIVSGSDDLTVRIWDANTARLLRTLEGHTGSVRSIAWSPEEDRILTGAFDRTVRIWNADSGGCLRILEDHTDSVTSVAWSPQGDRIVSGSDLTVRIWDANTARLLHTLEGHTGKVNSVAWSPLGDRIASGGGDHTVRIWDANTGAPLHILVGQKHLVRSIAWSPQGDRIVSGAEDGTVRIWDSASGSLVATLFNMRDGNWITYIPSGYFIGSPRVVECVRMARKKGNREYPLPLDNPNPEKVAAALTVGQVARANAKEHATNQDKNFEEIQNIGSHAPQPRLTETT